MSYIAPKPPFFTLLYRGACRLCPNCGHGAVMTGYVKQLPACPNCNEDFRHISADDAPPWLTIVVVGHIMLSLVLAIETNFRFPVEYEVPILVALAAALTFVLLPICKGVVIAVMWRVTERE
ncbi:MAG: DUF983 domain-containing protein [Rhodospirillaceae bacterium]|nr:DUF983 domain-containing protein [Rhodospirillaceae bacterium]